MLLSRMVLGLGLGGGASIVPLLESECSPSPKRARLLTAWQFNVALGLFLGFCASYLFHDDNGWR